MDLDRAEIVLHAALLAGSGFLLALLFPHAHARLRRRYPAIDDWAALGVSVAFTGLAVFLLVATPDWRTAVVTLAFFGGAALLFATLLVRKRRARRFRALSVSIQGGRDIRAGEGLHLVGSSLGLVLVGATIFFVGVADPWLMRGIGALMALAGLAVLVLRASGFIGRQFLRFEPEGIVFGERRFEFRLGWDNIAALAAREFADNPVVLIAPADVGALEPTPAQAWAWRRLYRHLRRNDDWLGAPIVIMPWTFGLDAAPLVAALERYRREPAARRELAARPAGGERLAALPRR